MRELLCFLIVDRPVVERRWTKTTTYSKSGDNVSLDLIVQLRYEYSGIDPIGMDSLLPTVVTSFSNESCMNDIILPAFEYSTKRWRKYKMATNASLLNDLEAVHVQDKCP